MSQDGHWEATSIEREQRRFQWKLLYFISLKEILRK